MSDNSTYRFGLAVEKFVFPLALQFGLRYACLEDRIYALSSDVVAAKVYFPECHGFDITVCLSPRLSRMWNHGDERGFVWYVRFLQLSAALPKRGSAPSVDALVQAYVGPMREVLGHFSMADAMLWKQFYDFYEQNSA